MKNEHLIMTLNPGELSPEMEAALKQNSVELAKSKPDFSKITAFDWNGVETSKYQLFEMEENSPHSPSTKHVTIEIDRSKTKRLALHFIYK